MFRRFSTFIPSASRGSRARWLTVSERRVRRISISFPKAADTYWSNSGSIQPTRPARRRRGSPSGRSSCRTAPVSGSTRRPRREPCGGSAKLGPAPPRLRPGAPLEWEGWDDAAVAPEKLGAYLRDLRALLDEYQYQTGFYGHFGHGCIHMRVNFDFESEAGIRKYAEFVESRSRSGRQLRRLAFWRAWGRPVARRVAAEDVRRRVDGRFSRVQGHLGSR